MSAPRNWLAKIAAPALATACVAIASAAGAPILAAELAKVRTPGTPGVAGTYHLDLTIAPSTAKAGEPVELVFQAVDPRGRDIRFLEAVHERPLHLLIVSEDLAEFEHVHPEQLVGTTYNLKHAFPHGGRYRLYADYTPPGSGTLVDQFTVEVDGPTRPAVRLAPDRELTKVIDGVKVVLEFNAPLRAGVDLPFTCAFFDAATGEPVTDLSLYLGSLAHIVLIHEDLGSFVHVHPHDAGEVYDPVKESAAHVHDPKELAKRLVGPSPSHIEAVAGFPRAGIYKMWVQFQRKDRLIFAPFIVRVVAAPAVGQKPQSAIPDDAIRVTVGASGYQPARIDVEKGRPLKLAFLRPDADNCGGALVFPSLNRRYDLPVGETVVVEIDPADSGEIAFTCGMGMYKGLVVVNESRQRSKS